jgi:aspartyl-tRNA(Asn)/glutamyl-tRNA(Gln) amidotransferase subunit A
MEVHPVSMPSLRFAMPAYYIIATTEASTNLARYCGMRFGVPESEYHQHFNDFFSGVRSEQFGTEAKRRILLGTFCRMVGFRNKYYLKALGVRDLVLEEYERVLKDHSFIVSPTMPFLAPRFDEISSMRPVEMYQADFLTIPPNLTGLPHISVPCAYAHGLPIGMQLVAPHWHEGALVHIAESWERHFTFRFPEVPR